MSITTMFAGAAMPQRHYMPTNVWVDEEPGRIVACWGQEFQLSIPELVGSEKQIAWARSLRLKRFEGVVDFFALAARRSDSMAAQVREMAPRVMKAFERAECRVWIDERDLTTNEWIKRQLNG